MQRVIANRVKIGFELKSHTVPLCGKCDFRMFASHFKQQVQCAFIHAFILTPSISRSHFFVFLKIFILLYLFLWQLLLQLLFLFSRLLQTVLLKSVFVNFHDYFIPPSYFIIDVLFSKSILLFFFQTRPQIQGMIILSSRNCNFPLFFVKTQK